MSTRTPPDAALVERARGLTTSGRAVLGLCGVPGAGKSTLAARLAAEIGPEAVVVPLDGFHLHDDELARLGLSQRKGAPETFDVAGYTALLHRIRTETGTTVYAPEFDRSRELSVAGAIAVRPEHRLVVTEGNYLLHDDRGWSEVRPLLDEAWYVEGTTPPGCGGSCSGTWTTARPPTRRTAWATESDQANADLVARTRASADLLVCID